MPTFLGTLLDGLASGDFPTRKAAADVLTALAQRLGPAMIPFREEVLVILEDLRFDKVSRRVTFLFWRTCQLFFLKVKPVREAVVQAVDAYKGISGPGTPALSDERPKTPSRRQSTPQYKYLSSPLSLIYL